MTLIESQLPETPQRLRFTREEYYQLAEQGFFHEKRVELIEGEIIEMAPQKNPHVLSVSLVTQVLIKVFGENYWLRSQAPLSVGVASDPEPDLALVSSDLRTHEGAPSVALLVVEVSDSTLRYDRTKKAGLYARAGVADYWIINLVSHCVEVLREPMEDPMVPGGFRYGSTITLRAPATVSPLIKPEATIKVEDLLP